MTTCSGWLRSGTSTVWSNVGTIEMMREREVRKYIESEGGTIRSVKRSKHWLVTAEFDGVEIRVVLSSSPSCHRSLLNTRKWIWRQVAAVRETMK